MPCAELLRGGQDAGKLATGAESHTATAQEAGRNDHRNCFLKRGGPSTAWPLRPIGRTGSRAMIPGSAEDSSGPSMGTSSPAGHRAQGLGTGVRAAGPERKTKSALPFLRKKDDSFPDPHTARPRAKSRLEPFVVKGFYMSTRNTSEVHGLSHPLHFVSWPASADRADSIPTL